MLILKQERSVRGTQQKLDTICNIFLPSTLLIGLLILSTGCFAKLKTEIKFLNDDYTLPTRTINYDASYSFSSDTQQPKMPLNNLYKNYPKRISHETVHRILRDKSEPIIYRPNGLKFFRKKSSSTTKHEISKRSLDFVFKESPGTALNLTDRNLRVFSRKVINTSRPLEEITSIILHNNYLREFPISVLPNLTVLDLSQNSFTHFELPVESNKLRFLNLNRNRIQNFTILTLKNAQGSKTIRELHLKDNAIHWPGLVNLSSLSELEVLDLSCNQLDNQETVLFPTRMKNLKYLNLARNRLQYIYRETFYNLLSMNTLILSYNEIKEINYETFLALPNLQYLDLSHNQLKGDSIRALQGIPDLVGLSIANNRELGDSMEEFVASWSLKELDASATGLCKIPAVLAQSVRILKLADNWLTIINCGDLDSYPLLQYLDLSNSHIDEIEEDAFGRLEILETLFLDHNNLKKIPVSLPTTLEHLFLQDNQIMDVPLQLFQGLNNLKTLDLSSNKLIYLPDLPLPKLITLNLQSSGINSLHQGIIKTSPHLRDLFLEDNPIKCSDLLGITEWASPCRNDRRIAKRINIKLYYVQMHNYFERFQCFGVDVDKCTSCFGDMSFQRKKVHPQPNCVDFTKTTKQKTAKQSTTTKPTTMFTEKGKYINKIRDTANKTHIQNSPTAAETNQNELKTTSSSTQNLAAQSVVPKRKTNTGRKKQTNSANKISLSATKEEKHDLEYDPHQFQLRIKSENNYTAKSFESNGPSESSLLSQKNTSQFETKLSAKSDNETQIARGINKEISDTAVKSNCSRIMVFEEQNRSTPIRKLRLPMTATTEAMPLKHIPREKTLNQLKTQYSKDRHLIGTPLLMRKGQSVSGSQRLTYSKEANLKHLSKAHKLKVIVGALGPFFYPQQQPQQQQKGNSINKGPPNQAVDNIGLLGRDIQSTLQLDDSQLWMMQKNKQINKIDDQNKIMPNNSTRNINQKFKENFLSQRVLKGKKTVHFPQQAKQFASKLEFTIETEHHHYGLTTPLNTKIRGYDQLLEGIKGLEYDSDASSTEPTLENHHSQINTSLMESENDLQTVYVKGALKPSQEFLVKSKGKYEDTTAVLMKLEDHHKPTTSSRFQQENTITSERLLNIRNARKHPGLVAVIGVTFTIVFVVGLLHIYRYRNKSLNCISHRQNHLYQHYARHQSQFPHQKEAHCQNNLCYHNLQHHQLRMYDKHNNKGYCCFKNKQNQQLRYIFDEDRTFSQLQGANKNLSYNLECVHEKSPVSSGPQAPKSVFNYEFQREECLLSNSVNVNTAKRSSRCTTFNYSLFQIKKHHYPPPDNKNNVYMEMHHVQQSVLAADLFPMELLTAPRIQSASSASMEIPSPKTVLPIFYSDQATAEHKDQQQGKSNDIEYQDINLKNTTGRKKSKFDIW